MGEDENKNSEDGDTTQTALRKERPPEGKGSQKYQRMWAIKEDEP